MTLTSYPNGVKGFVVECNAEVEKKANYTVVYGTDSGKVFHANTDEITFTLPGIQSGQSFTFVNTADDAMASLIVMPDAADGIMYKEDSTDNTGIKNTKTTHKCGDKVTIYNVAGTDYWNVGDITGIWDKT
jgi:hypothetical protein